MMWWEKCFLSKLETLVIKVLLYKRYVDDIIIVLKAIDKRLEYEKEEDRLKLSEEENNESNDIHDMNILKLVGNQVHQSIQLESECPSMHEDKKLPVLDLKIWVNKTGDNNKIMHEYYQKEVASKMVVHSRSSLPWSSKRTVLTQEVLRILLRCSPELPWPTVKEHVDNFMKRMQFAGYTPKFKGEIVCSATKAYKKLRDMDRQNTQPLYR